MAPAEILPSCLQQLLPWTVRLHGVLDGSTFRMSVALKMQPHGCSALQRVVFLAADVMIFQLSWR
jgi:hypothetical protein